jgi:integration host factor subunit beta
LATITKREIAEDVARKTGHPQLTVKQILQSFFDEVIAEVVKGNRLEFRDFGVFEVRTRQPRMAQNPRTLERVRVPARSTVKFKVGRHMKAAVQNVASDTPPAEPDRPPVDQEAQPSAPSQVSPPPGT